MATIKPRIGQFRVAAVPSGRSIKLQAVQEASGFSGVRSGGDNDSRGRAEGEGSPELSVGSVSALISSSAGTLPVARAGMASANTLTN